MNRAALEEAQQKLAIQSVLLFQSRFEIREGFDLRLAGETLVVGVQLTWGAKRSYMAQYQKSPSEAFSIFKIETGTLIRLFDSTKVGESPTPEQAIEHKIAELDAIFLSEYLVAAEKEISEEAQSEFAIHNALYHVWPYWREYANNILTRAGFPGVMVPMFVPSPAATDEIKNTK